MTEYDTRLSNLKEFDKLLSKKFGSEYTGFGEKDSFERVKRVSLDCVSLNNLLGGGLPVGRVVEIYGNNSVGKSALATHFVASYQKQGKVCMWVDAEHSLDPDFMTYCGVDLNLLCKHAPQSAEGALEAIRTAMRADDAEGNPVLSLVVLDSVAALTPRNDFDEKKEIGSTMIGSLARLMSTSLKQLVTIAAEKNITLVLINQERACNMTGYGPKTTTTGGSAVKYYCSIRLDLNRSGWLEEDKQKVGQVINVETTKNKTFAPHKKAEIHLIFPTQRAGRIVAGVDTLADVVNIAIDNDIICRSGAWFKWGEERFQGIKKVYNTFIEDADKYAILYEQVQELYNDDPKEENN